jgi:hypothetical protein
MDSLEVMLAEIDESLQKVEELEEEEPIPFFPLVLFLKGAVWAGHGQETEGRRMPWHARKLKRW